MKVDSSEAALYGDRTVRGPGPGSPDRCSLLEELFVRIAFQGEPGAYSEAAALRFSDHSDLLPCETFEAVFTAVAGGKATHGILPVEYSIGGNIAPDLQLLL